MPRRNIKDALGEVSIPEGKMWGASTQRAVENFPISQLRFASEFYPVFASVKKSCAQANAKAGALDPGLAKAIEWACDQVLKGQHQDQFPVDVFQTGSGTSTNMNFNEVISFLASKKKGVPVHPNDHVNLGQSSNDVFPTVIQVSCCSASYGQLIPSAKKLIQAIQKKRAQFKGVIKVGRTHLQDAAPLTLEQEFSGYGAQMENSLERVVQSLERMKELPLGGTAVGTGLNTWKGFGTAVAKNLSKTYEIAFREAPNHFEAQSSLDRCLDFSSSVRGLAMSLYKIANDLRWLGSGPRAGLGEFILPAVQPGSSIMPGKINPVIPEAVLQVCVKVIGNDSTLTWAIGSSQFQLNTMMPLIAYTLLESVEILSNAIDVFVRKCLNGLEINQERIEENLKNNAMLVTPFASLIGYDKAAAIAKDALQKRRSILDSAKELSGLSDSELEKVLDPKKMLGPQKK